MWEGNGKAFEGVFKGPSTANNFLAFSSCHCFFSLAVPISKGQLVSLQGREIPQGDGLEASRQFQIVYFTWNILTVPSFFVVCFFLASSN